MLQRSLRALASQNLSGHAFSVPVAQIKRRLRCRSTLSLRGVTDDIEN
jgi:hypothetical protein